MTKHFANVNLRQKRKLVQNYVCILKRIKTMTDSKSFTRAGVISQTTAAQIDNVSPLSGASKEDMKNVFSAELVAAKEEMGFNREFAKFAYTVVNGKEPSELDMQKMKINADNSVQLSHPAWTFTKSNDAQKIANQIVNASKGERI